MKNRKGRRVEGRKGFSEVFLEEVSNWAEYRFESTWEGLNVGFHLLEDLFKENHKERNVVLCGEHIGTYYPPRTQGFRPSGEAKNVRSDKHSAVSHGTGMNWAPTMSQGFCPAEWERPAQALLSRSSGSHRPSLFWEKKKESIKVLTQAVM